MITSSLHTDYDSNIKKDKDRARAFHTCKMKLAGHVSLPLRMHELRATTRKRAGHVVKPPQPIGDGAIVCHQRHDTHAL